MPVFAERAHNLPRNPSSFVGRERERAEVADLLRSAQLLTLVGPGGVGKTRLALQVASEALDDYPDGVWLVELAPLVQPELVPQAVAHVLGVREQPDVPLVSSVCETLGRSRQLLVLDNCEQVIEACAQVADSVLRSCEHVRILATSREPLGVVGEVLWRVPPLSVPEPETSADAADAARSPAPCDLPPNGGPPEPSGDEADAVRLFVERATASLPSFRLTPSNRAEVMQMCRRLDGLPLAIELAAARMRLLSLNEMLGLLEDRFKLLTGGSRTAPRRQQTLEAAVAWSYDLLTADERRLFENASVFADGFSLASLAAVADSQADAFDLLGRLVDRSLVMVEPPRADGQTRYRLLETLRAFAWQRLVARGDAERVQRRLADWLVETAARAEAAFHGPEQGRWLRWAETEHGNVRVALNWLVERQDTESALRLVTGLWWSWMQRGRRQESQAAFEQCLRLPGAATYGRLWGRLLVAAGIFSVVGGSADQAAARAWLEEALRLGRESNDAWVYLNARAGLNGIVDLRTQNDLERVRRVSEEVRAEARRARSAWGENRALVSIAMVALKQGDFDAAQAALEQAVEVARGAQDAWSLAMTLVPLGDLERARGRHALARAVYDESLTRLAEIGLADHPLQHPYLLHNLGYVALAEGQTADAWRRFRDALAGYRRMGDQRGAAECLIGLGAVAAADERADAAVRLFAAGETALAALDTELWPANQSDYQRWRGVASAALGPEAFEAAWTAGMALSTDEALALAQTPAGTEPRAVPRSATLAAPAALTPRELEVARLVAAGLTNRQIGERLIIAEKTAANHVQRLLDKLGLHSRAQVAARAAALGLQPADRAGVAEGV